MRRRDMLGDQPVLCTMRISEATVVWYPQTDISTTSTYVGQKLIRIKQLKEMQASPYEMSHVEFCRLVKKPNLSLALAQQQSADPEPSPRKSETNRIPDYLATGIKGVDPRHARVFSTGEIPHIDSYFDHPKPINSDPPSCAPCE